MHDPLYSCCSGVAGRQDIKGSLTILDRCSNQHFSKDFPLRQFRASKIIMAVERPAKSNNFRSCLRGDATGDSTNSKRCVVLSQSSKPYGDLLSDAVCASWEESPPSRGLYCQAIFRQRRRYFSLAHSVANFVFIEYCEMLTPTTKLQCELSYILLLIKKQPREPHQTTPHK